MNTTSKLGAHTHTHTHIQRAPHVCARHRLPKARSKKKTRAQVNFTTVLQTKMALGMQLSITDITLGRSMSVAMAQGSRRPLFI